MKKIEIDVTKIKEVTKSFVEIESPYREGDDHIFKVILNGIDSKNKEHDALIKDLKEKVQRKENDRIEYRIILNNTLVTGYGFVKYARSHDGGKRWARFIFRFETGDFIYQNGPQVNRNLKLDSILESLDD